MTDSSKIGLTFNSVSSNIQISLKQETSPEWIIKVKEEFDEFLLDHAACERKASATGISLVCRFPDRLKLIEPMIRLAREELQHFHQVYRIILKRNLKFLKDEKTPYINAMMKLIRHGRDVDLLDRLLIFGIVEARGTDRFGIVANNIEDPELKDFYERLTQAEARHHQLFIDVAKYYFDDDEISNRLEFLIEKEAELIRSLPIRAAVH